MTAQRRRLSSSRGAAAPRVGGRPSPSIPGPRIAPPAGLERWSIVRNRWVHVAAALAALVVAHADVAAQEPSFNRYEEVRGFDMTVGSDGAIWVRGTTNYLTRVSLSGQTRTFRIRELPRHTGAEVVAGSDGAVWFTQLDRGRIGRLTQNGKVSLFSVRSSRGRPARAVSNLVQGHDGRIWFLTDAGDLHHEISAIDRAGNVTSVPLGRAIRPRSLARGPGRDLVFTADRIGRGRETMYGTISSSGRVRIYRPGLAAGCCPFLLATGGDNRLWVDGGRAKSGRPSVVRVGREDRQNRFELPAGVPDPMLLTPGLAGPLWFGGVEYPALEGESGRTAIGRVIGGRASEPLFTSDEVARAMLVGPDGSLWVLLERGLTRLAVKEPRPLRGRARVVRGTVSDDRRLSLALRCRSRPGSFCRGAIRATTPEVDDSKSVFTIQARDQLVVRRRFRGAAPRHVRVVIEACDLRDKCDLRTERVELSTG